MTAKLPDKKHAPKKTGRRMPPPEDLNDDSKKVEEIDKPSKGGSLLVEQPPKPTVVDDRMQAFYIKPVWSKLPKSGDIIVALRMSMELGKEHKDLLPKVVAAAYIDVKKRGRTGLSLRVPSQKVTFYLTDADDDPVLDILARISNANLRLVERKGEGAARKVVRFSFDLQTKYEAHVAKFADINLGNHFWLEIEETQAKLFDDEGAEDEEDDDEENNE